MDSNITAIFNAATAVQKTLDNKDATIADLNAQIAALKGGSPPVGGGIGYDGRPYTQQALNIQNMGGWIQPSNTGDTGGGSNKPHGTFTMTPGDTATFSAQGGYPYNNGYFYKNLGAFNTATDFLLTAEVLIVDTQIAQAIEFVVEKCVDGVVWDMEWQHPLGQFASAGNQNWRVFNRLSKNWEPTSIPISMKSNQWMKIAAEFFVTEGKFDHTGLTVDGKKTVLNPVLSHLSAPAYSAGTNYLHVAFQLDTNGRTPPTPYTCQMRNCNLYWG